MTIQTTNTATAVQSIPEVMPTKPTMKISTMNHVSYRQAEPRHSMTIQTSNTAASVPSIQEAPTLTWSTTSPMFMKTNFPLLLRLTFLTMTTWPLKALGSSLSPNSRIPLSSSANYKVETHQHFCMTPRCQRRHAHQTMLDHHQTSEFRTTIILCPSYSHKFGVCRRPVCLPLRVLRNL